MHDRQPQTGAFFSRQDLIPFRTCPFLDFPLWKTFTWPWRCSPRSTETLGGTSGCWRNPVRDETIQNSSKYVKVSILYYTNTNTNTNANANTNTISYNIMDIILFYILLYLFPSIFEVFSAWQSLAGRCQASAPGGRQWPSTAPWAQWAPLSWGTPAPAFHPRGSWVTGLKYQRWLLHREMHKRRTSFFRKLGGAVPVKFVGTLFLSSDKKTVSTCGITMGLSTNPNCTPNGPSISRFRVWFCRVSTVSIPGWASGPLAAKVVWLTCWRPRSKPSSQRESKVFPSLACQIVPWCRWCHDCRGPEF